MPKVSPMARIKAEARAHRLKDIGEMLSRSVNVCLDSEESEIVAAGYLANEALGKLNEAIRHLDSLEAE